MLHDGALRIQDALGLKFEQITKLKPNNKGIKILSLPAKKTTARRVVVSEDVIKAVKDYQTFAGSSDSDIMFTPGPTNQPTAKWIKKISRFFKKHGIAVQTHDFRTTMLTWLYNKTKDIVLVQEFAGHSSIEITRKYIKVDQMEMHERLQEVKSVVKPNKRARR